MAMTKTKRTKMMKLIDDVFLALDPSGANVEKYRNMFDKMSDSQFDSFFKAFFNNPDEYLILDIIDYERDIKIENIEKAAKIMDVPLFEKVAIPFSNMNKDNPIITKYPVPVGRLHCSQ